MLESYAFIEAFGIVLCLNVYLFCIEVLSRSLNGIKHDLLTIALPRSVVITLPIETSCMWVPAGHTRAKATTLFATVSHRCMDF